MRARWLHFLVLASAAVCIADQQPKSQPKQPTAPATTASGVFLGKSGKPMVGARLILCEAPTERPRIKLLPNVPTATTDAAGKFTFRGFTPGKWTILYLPAGMDAAVPNEIDVTPLEAEDKSILPLLNRVELGTNKPYEAKQWSTQFTLMKGHTYWSMGAKMKIWNATVRRGATGPFLEMRRGSVVQVTLEDKGQIQLEAWSF